MRRRLHNPIALWVAIGVFVGLPIWASFAAMPLTIGWVAHAIREIAPWQTHARVNPDFSADADTVIVQRWFSTLDAFETDDPPAWADDLDWWGKDDGLDKWQAYDMPEIRRPVRGLILGVATTTHHMRGIWAITRAPMPADAELLALANARAGTVNQWNDSWSDRVAADGLVRINKRVDSFLNPVTLAVDLLWLLSPLVALDAWRHRRRWPSRVRDTAKCPKCRYDRAGLASDVRCPECGTSAAS